MSLQEKITHAKLTISQIESDFSNVDSITHKALMSKGQIIRLYAETFEFLSINDSLDIPVNQIANHIMKRMKEMKANVFSTYVYDSLPAKYKSHRLNPTNGDDDGLISHSDNPREDASYITPEEENKPEIDFWKDQMTLCKKVITHLKSNSFLLKKESDTYLLEKEYSEELIIRKSAQKYLDEAFDDRKTVPLRTISLLLDSFFHANNNYAASNYITRLKEYGSQKKQSSFKAIQANFSSKQLTKILKGHVTELHLSLEILTQQDAYDNGFFGKTNCPECGSWRIILDQKYVHGQFSIPELSCFACGKTSEAPRVKLPLSTATPQ